MQFTKNRHWELSFLFKQLSQCQTVTGGGSGGGGGCGGSGGSGGSGGCVLERGAPSGKVQATTAWYFPPFKLPFPAVTFCNQNRVNCERLRSLLKTDQDQRLSWIEDNLCKDRKVWKTLNGSRHHSGGPDGHTLSPLQREFLFLQNYMSLNESARISIGHDFPSFMKNCTFRGNNCLNMRSVWWDLTLLWR